MAINYTEDFANRFNAAYTEWLLPNIAETVIDSHAGLYVFLGTALKGINGDWRKASQELVHNAKNSAGPGMYTGKNIQKRITLSAMTAATTGTGFQAISNTINVQFLGRAIWCASPYYTPVRLASDERMVNDSYSTSQKQAEADAIDLFGTAIKHAIASQQDNMADDIFGGSTFYPSTTNDCGSGFIPLDEALSDSGIYGNVDRASYSNWAGNKAVRTLTSIGDQDSTSYIYTMAYSMYQNAVKNNAQKKNLMFFAGSSIATQKTLNGNATMDSVGQGITGRYDMANGNVGVDVTSMFGIPVVYETSLPAGYLYLLDLSVAELNILRGGMFKIGPWQLQESFSGEINRINSMGQLTVSDPSRCSVTIWE